MIALVAILDIKIRSSCLSSNNKNIVLHEVVTFSCPRDPYYTLFRLIVKFERENDRINKHGSFYIKDLTLIETLTCVILL